MVGCVDAVNAKFTYYGSGDEKLDVTTIGDAAAYTAELAFDRSAKGFFRSEYSLSSPFTKQEGELEC